MDAQGPVGRKVAAAIIAGGQGTRLGGVAKGLLRVAGRPIIDTQVALLSPLFSRVFIVTNDPSPYAYLKVPCFPDHSGQGLGPLAGIETALRTLIDETSVVCVGADMPFLHADVLCALRDLHPEASALAPFVRGLPEPLCARYGGGALPTITALLAARKLKLMDALATIGVVPLPEQAWRCADPDARFAININTPEALADAQSEAR
ncbi:MAG: molybdenum cofactor guanylyltransferase [Deltaproteobacteria bacterium]|nr:molybdenum cofactor guanylyltransferase [Deltaproteobacteria bacterium]